MLTTETDNQATAARQSPQQPAAYSNSSSKRNTSQQLHMMNPKTRSEVWARMGARVVDKAWQDWVVASGILVNK